MIKTIQWRTVSPQLRIVRYR